MCTSHSGDDPCIYSPRSTKPGGGLCHDSGILCPGSFCTKSFGFCCGDCLGYYDWGRFKIRDIAYQKINIKTGTGKNTQGMYWILSISHRGCYRAGTFWSLGGVAWRGLKGRHQFHNRSSYHQGNTRNSQGSVFCQSFASEAGKLTYWQKQRGLCTNMVGAWVGVGRYSSIYIPYWKESVEKRLQKIIEV